MWLGFAEHLTKIRGWAAAREDVRGASDQLRGLRGLRSLGGMLVREWGGDKFFLWRLGKESS